MSGKILIGCIRLEPVIGQRKGKAELEVLETGEKEEERRRETEDGGRRKRKKRNVYSLIPLPGSLGLRSWVPGPLFPCLAP